MKKFFSVLLIIIQLFIGGVFIYSGVLKIAEPEKFAMSVENYRILPRILVNIFAIYLPWLEVITGALIIYSPWRKGAALIFSGLIMIFLFGIILAMIRGLDIECGCFGEGSRQVGIPVLIEDFSLLVLGLIVFFKEWKTESEKIKTETTDIDKEKELCLYSE